MNEPLQTLFCLLCYLGEGPVAPSKGLRLDFNETHKPEEDVCLGVHRATFSEIPPLAPLIPLNASLPPASPLYLHLRL